MIKFLNTKLLLYFPALCFPVGVLWLTISYIKAFTYKILPFLRYESKIPVICIGNCSAGGNGKTPTVIYLAKNLSRNNKVGILLRGYKGNLSSNTPVLVDNHNTVLEVGDEALIYKNLLPDNTKIVICSSRKNGIKKLEQEGVDIILMDDGLQHLKVKPKISYCLVDVKEINNYVNYPLLKIIPLGKFREDPNLSFKRSNIVVFISREKISDKILIDINKIINKYKIKKFSVLEILPSKIVDSLTFEEVNFNKQSISFSVFTSIAKPDEFLLSLKNLGHNVVDKKIFPDHYCPNKQEWENSLITMEKPIICTYKDYIKISSFSRNKNEVLVLLQDISEFNTPNSVHLLNSSLLNYSSSELS